MARIPEPSKVDKRDMMERLCPRGPMPSNREVLEQKVADLVRCCETDVADAERRLARAKDMQRKLSKGAALDCPPPMLDFGSRTEQRTVQVDLLLNLESEREARLAPRK